MFTLYSGAEHVLAQPEELSIELPSDVPPLPDQRETDRPLYISARNAAVFHELLLAPVTQWFKEGKFVARVVKSLPFRFELSPTWNEQSRKYSETILLNDITPSALPAAQSLGLPFGTRQAIQREQDPRRRARMILWNMEFVTLPARDALYLFEYGWLSPSIRQRTATGFYFSELYPKEDLFRADLLHFTGPAVIAGMAQLSQRPLTGAEDSLWIVSPVIGKSRQVLDPNRGDPIMGSLFSMDDFLVFSTNVNAVEANVLEERTMLVPFPTVVPVQLSREPFTSPVMKLPAATGDANVSNSKPTSSDSALTANGPYRGKSGNPAFATWNADNAEHPQGASWIPTSAVFVPRRVWVIEISKQDPYYLLGRQILVVDQESMLPVYKVVYDRRGVYIRTFAAGWTLGVAEKSDFKTPVLGFVLAVDRALGAAVSFTTQSFQTFEGKKSSASDAVRALLDAAAYAAQPGTSSTASAPKTSPKTSTSPAAPDESPDDLPVD